MAASIGLELGELMSVEYGVEILALALAVWATWLSIPRPPALDWERLFKTSLATVIRGEVEAADGDALAWETRLRAEVPYHPAGRDLERWLTAPDLDAVQVPALEGERSLVTALTLLPDPAARYSYATGDSKALDALMGDPAWLGEDYDPGPILGPGASWDAVAAWAPEIVEGFVRRLSHVVFVGLGERDWQALSPVPGLRVLSLSSAEPQEVEEALEAELGLPSDRIIIGISEGCSDGVLQLMASRASVRDRVLAVVSFGVELRTDWALQGFTHEAMEPELQRSIPFFSLVHVDPGAPVERAWDPQRFWDPPLPAGGRPAIQAIDLGPVPLGSLSDQILGRALWTTLVFRLAQGS